MLKRIVFSLVAGVLAMTAVDAQAAVVNISGTHNNAGGFSYRPFEINTGVLFDPLAGPVTVTGTVDLTSLPGNSSVFVGLISKIDYDSWISDGYAPNDDWFGFIDTAYATFNTSNGGRLGLGQYLTNNDNTQGYVVDSGLGLADITDWELTFDATTFSLTYPGGNPQIDRPYVDTRELVTSNAVPTDWSEGAYAFVSTYFDDPGAPEIDVTFNGPTAVPEPASVCLMSLGGIALFGFGLRRRRKSAAATTAV